MLHIAHLIQRRRGGRSPALALAAISALGLAAGLLLLAGR